jgi:hypothetical protein
MSYPCPAEWFGPADEVSTGPNPDSARVVGQVLSTKAALAEPLPHGAQVCHFTLLKME